MSEKIIGPSFNREGKIDKEDSIGDFKANLDDSITSREMWEIADKRSELDQSVRDIMNQPEVTDYFSNKTELADLKEEIEHLRPLIEAASSDAKSNVSIEKLEKSIARLRKLEERFRILNEDMESRFKNNIHVIAALRDIAEVNKKVQSLDERAKRSVELNESKRRENSNEETKMSLN